MTITTGNGIKCQTPADSSKCRSHVKWHKLVCAIEGSSYSVEGPYFSMNVQRKCIQSICRPLHFMRLQPLQDLLLDKLLWMAKDIQPVFDVNIRMR